MVEYIRLIRQQDHTGITKAEYKHQDEKNKTGYLDFDRVGNIKILDKNEEIYQVDSDFYQN